MGFAAFGPSGRQVVTAVTDRNNSATDINGATIEDLEENDGGPGAIRGRVALADANRAPLQSKAVTLAITLRCDS